MQRRTVDGGITTTDEQVMHTVWPCVTHPPAVPCLTAQRAASHNGSRVLKPQPKKVPDANNNPR